ncbi:archaetidylserine decarboxylase [Halotalea alkalilenta]|uniref:archaetidylserine decarboxylase n=1 Tax=Halotalea alkalilenta TaxID=376489 RepID=UPI0005BA3C1D|nr:archaetidylserine decarboxylase [Halotalea alkalilenta]
MPDLNRDKLFAALQYPLPHALISRLAGRIASARTPWLKNLLIQRFARLYGIDMSEAEIEDPRAYACFNDFFTRALKPGARPIEEGIVSPADGAVSQCGAIRHASIFQAKGHEYSVDTLLGGGDVWSEPFRHGSFATIYLSPRDYHRVHMPCAGRLRRTVYVPGRIFSVNRATAAEVPHLFARNERLVCHFDTEYGPMAMVLVGAMIVAGIETVWAGQVPPHGEQIQRHDFSDGVSLDKGAEMGRFKLGSTVILCFGEGVAPVAQLAAGDPLRLGQRLMQRI